MVIGLEEGKQNLSAFTPNRKFEEGDIIWLVGEQESINALSEVNV
jgi:CPA2 family monovalent cation:H+ antiporter-2